jgi:ribonuclease R
MFVELDNSWEGCIRAASMSDDFYVYDEHAMKLVGERYHKEYCLGQKVKIRVLGADRLTKTIDFKIYDETMDDGSDDDFVVYSESRKVQENKANKIRKLMERAVIDLDDEDEDESEDFNSHEFYDEKPSKKKKKAKDSDDKRLVEHNGMMVDINDVEPDPRTGKMKLKKGKKASFASAKSAKPSRKRKGKGSDKEDGSTKESGRKVYKVHKYKKSATSKAARSAQGRGRRKKK